MDMMTNDEAKAWRDARWDAGDGAHFTEIQLTNSGFDIVSAKLEADVLRLDPYRVSRWWHSEQNGYHETKEAAIAEAKRAWPSRDLIVMDCRR